MNNNVDSKKGKSFIPKFKAYFSNEAHIILHRQPPDSKPPRRRPVYRKTSRVPIRVIIRRLSSRQRTSTPTSKFESKREVHRQPWIQRRRTILQQTDPTPSTSIKLLDFLISSLFLFSYSYTSN